MRSVESGGGRVCVSWCGKGWGEALGIGESFLTIISLALGDPGLLPGFRGRSWIVWAGGGILSGIVLLGPACGAGRAREECARPYLRMRPHEQQS